MAKRNRCECGKVMSKYGRKCNACHEARMNEVFAQGAAIVAGGKCPQCGSGLRTSSALPGWWTCEQRGSADFRARAWDPACSFDCSVGGAK